MPELSGQTGIGVMDLVDWIDRRAWWRVARPVLAAFWRAAVAPLVDWLLFGELLR
jgi:hypothetical protein